MSIKNNKRRGRNFETRTKELFKELGHTVMKTSVSDENPDIITFYNGCIYLIEVKSVQNPRKTQVISQLRKQLQKYMELKREIESQKITTHVCCVVWVKCGRRYKYFMETGISDIEKFLNNLQDFLKMC